MSEVALELPENPYIGMNPNDLVDAFFRQREHYRERNRVAEEAKKELSLIEEALVEYHEENPSSKKIGTDMATVSFSKETVFNVTDWDGFFQHVAENNAFYLLQRRCNNTGLRELKQMGQLPPNVEPYEKVKIGCRKAS